MVVVWRWLWRWGGRQIWRSCRAEPSGAAQQQRVRAGPRNTAADSEPVRAVTTTHNTGQHFFVPRCLYPQPRAAPGPAAGVCGGRRGAVRQWAMFTLRGVLCCVTVYPGITDMFHCCRDRAHDVGRRKVARPISYQVFEDLRGARGPGPRLPGGEGGVRGARPLHLQHGGGGGPRQHVGTRYTVVTSHPANIFFNPAAGAGLCTGGSPPTWWTR